MDRFRNRFLNQVQVLQNQLENLLEKDWGPERLAQRLTPFEVQSDLAQLETLGWSLPLAEPERSQALFDRLAPYFETGLCFHSVVHNLELDWHRWRFESAFHSGEKLPLLPEDRERQLSLPRMTLMEVRRLNPVFLLRELHMPETLSNEETSALVVRPSDQRLWILFSHLPDVFLKPHLTQIHDWCLRLLADFPDDDPSF